MAQIKIHPLHVGTITRPISQFCYGLEPGRLAEFPLICWLIEGSEKKILVDTGGGDPSKAHPGWKPYHREREQAVENVLEKKGVKCEDIEIVIMSHLHWDHCAGNELFPNAKIIVQKEELESAYSPFPIFRNSYIKNIVKDINYSVLSGDKEIEKGITLIFTPGHTSGMQGVLVEAEGRRYFIASDTIPLYKNIETPSAQISATYVDLKSYYKSLEKILNLSAFILPSHDFKVFETDVYK